MSRLEGALSREQIEERRKNLTFIRENAPGDPVGDHLFTTTLLMQEEWLATVDALVAREGELVEKARVYLKRGLHLMGCNGFPHTKEPCDCGFQALKDALAVLGEKA